jgi:histidyl-tRNA synthetase
MQKADAWGARFAVIIGDDELARGEVGLKDLIQGTQQWIALGRLAEAVSD